MIYVYFYESVFLRQIYSYNFHFFKPNNLKVIHDLYSQYLTQTLSKTTSKSYMEGVFSNFSSKFYFKPFCSNIFPCLLKYFPLSGWLVWSVPPPPCFFCCPLVVLVATAVSCVHLYSFFSVSLSLVLCALVLAKFCLAAISLCL